MADLFTRDYQWLWTLALGLALFLPVRQLIWVLQVRRVEKRSGPTETADRLRLKKRAGVTAALLCFVFAVLYVNHLFQGRP